MNGLIGPNPHLPHTALTAGGGLGTFSPITQQPYTDTRYVKMGNKKYLLFSICHLGGVVINTVILLIFNYLVLDGHYKNFYILAACSLLK